MSGASRSMASRTTRRRSARLRSRSGESSPARWGAVESKTSRGGWRWRRAIQVRQRFSTIARNQPGKQGGVPETVETEVGAQEHLLGDVAGGVEISCPRQGDREDRVLVVLDQAGEGGLVAVEGGGHQRRGLYGTVQWIFSVSIRRERPAMERDVTRSTRVVLPLRCTPPAVMALSCPDLSNTGSRRHFRGPQPASPEYRGHGQIPQ